MTQPDFSSLRAATFVDIQSHLNDVYKVCRWYVKKENIELLFM